MRVILYGPDFNRTEEIGWRTTFALSEGLNRLGVKHDVRKTKHWIRDGREIADVCIVNGWWKKFIDGRDKINRNTVIRAQEAAGKPPWCIERAFLLDRDEWSSLSIGGFGVNGGEFRAEGMPPDRWEKLGIKLKPWSEGGDYILLCAQVPWDVQVQDEDHLHWIEAAMDAIQQHTGRPIVFRGHPKAWRQRDPYLPVVAFSEPPQTTFEEDVAHAHAVVCYNSNVSVIATICGVPVFTGAFSMAHPIANRDWSLLDDPPKPDREQWAWDLAYKQWCVEEFKEALPWLHLTG